jgi:uncharacterized membrane protein HdeD (DUF308 family)
MASTADSFALGSIPTTLRERWGWLLVFGIAQIIAGVLAIAVPPAASLAAVLIFGWVLIVSAVFHVVHAFKVRKWPGFALHLLGGLLYAAAGVVVLLFPLGGALTLALLLAALFVAEGVVRTVMALKLRPGEGWGWFLAGAVASILLGVILFLGWPAAAIWAIGLLLGINLIVSGTMNTVIALAGRPKKVPTEKAVST